MLCPDCEKEWEDFSPISGKNNILCPYCYEKKHEVYGISQITIRAKPKIHGNQRGDIDPGLGEYVGSEEDRKRIMRENNLVEVGDAPCSTTHLNDRNNLKAREEIDGELEHYGFNSVDVKSVDCAGFE